MTKQREYRPFCVHHLATWTCKALICLRIQSPVEPLAQHLHVVLRRACRTCLVVMPTSLSKAWSGASLEAAMGLVASQHSRHSVSQEQEASMQAELRDSLVLEMGSCDCPLLFFGLPCHEAGSCGGRRAPARQKGFSTLLFFYCW